MPESMPSFVPTQLIPLDKIKPSPYQARKDFDPAEIKALADSLDHEGLIQPITVRAVGDSFELIAGERRYRAAQSLGWTTLEAKVIQTISEGEAAAKGLVENLQREDLNPIGEALGFEGLNKMDPQYWTQDRIAQVCGKDRTYVTKSIALLNLSPEVQENVRQRTLTREHGIELARLEDKNQQSSLLKQVLARNLMVKETRKLVDQALGNNKAGGRRKGDKPGVPDPLSDLWATLGLKAQYKGGSKWNLDLDLGKAGDLKAALVDWFIKAAGTLQEQSKVQEAQRN